MNGRRQNNRVDVNNGHQAPQSSKPKSRPLQQQIILTWLSPMVLLLHSFFVMPTTSQSLSRDWLIDEGDLLNYNDTDLVYDITYEPPGKLPDPDPHAAIPSEENKGAAQENEGARLVKLRELVRKEQTKEP
jgi:hypothetical protein